MMGYYRFFVDVWRYFKRYYQSAEDTDTWWEQVIQDANDLCRKYKEHSFTIAVIGAVFDELERRVRGDRRGA